MDYDRREAGIRVGRNRDVARKRPEALAWSKGPMSRRQEEENYLSRAGSLKLDKEV